MTLEVGSIIYVLESYKERLDLLLINTMKNSIRRKISNGYCSRVGGEVRGWAKVCTCLMGNVWLITWRSFANLACYQEQSCL